MSFMSHEASIFPYFSSHGVTPSMEQRELSPSLMNNKQSLVCLVNAHTYALHRRGNTLTKTIRNKGTAQSLISPIPKLPSRLLHLRGRCLHFSMCNICIISRSHCRPRLCLHVPARTISLLYTYPTFLFLSCIHLSYFKKSASPCTQANKYPGMYNV